MSSHPKSGQRSARDLYITPVGVTEALLDELDRAFQWGPGARLRILDVGAGTGRITAACRAQWPNAHIVACEINADDREQLEAAGANVVWTCDFVAEPFEFVATFDLIIGNPPYSLAQAFLKQCLTFVGADFREPVIALLVNMNFLGSDDRVDWFDEHAERSHAIRVLAPRPSFTHEETGKLQTDSVEYAWWLWCNDAQVPELSPFGWYLWRTTRKRQKALLERGGAAEQ